MPLDLLLKRPPENYTELHEKQLLEDHRLMHGRYEQTEDEPKRREMELLHVKVVRKIFAVGADHDMVDDLDETLPAEIRARSDRHKDVKMAPGDDLESLGEKELREAHYMAHRLFRLYGEEEWGGFKSPQDWADYHAKIVTAMAAKEMAHIAQDGLDKIGCLEEEAKSVQLSQAPVTLEWMKHAAAAAELIQGETVLELNCGTGHFVEALGLSGYCVQGVESDPGAVKAAQMRGLAVEQANILEHLQETRQDSVDVVVSLWPMLKGMARREILGNALRCAKKCAVFVVSLDEETEGWKSLGAVQNDIHTAGYAIHEGFDNTALLIGMKSAPPGRITKAAEILRQTPSLMGLLRKAILRVACSRTKSVGDLKQGDAGPFALQIHDIRTLHMDLRLKVPSSRRQNAFVGWQIFIPGKLRKVTEGNPEKTLRSTGKAVVAHLLGGGTLTGSPKDVVGSASWIGLGRGRMETFPAGKPGASPNKEGHLLAVDWGSYKAGPDLEGKHSVFYKLQGRKISGRWLMAVGVRRSELGPKKGDTSTKSEERTWFFRLLKEGSEPKQEGTDGD